MDSTSSDSLNSDFNSLEEDLEVRLHPSEIQSRCLQFIFFLLKWLFYFCIPKKQTEKKNEKKIRTSVIMCGFDKHDWS